MAIVDTIPYPYYYGWLLLLLGPEAAGGIPFICPFERNKESGSFVSGGAGGTKGKEFTL